MLGWLRKNLNLANFINLGSCLAFWSYLQRYSSYVTDDAFIHFRIARNFVEYGEPYYNLGEVVMGSSAHLWVNLMALYFQIFGYQLDYIFCLSWILVVLLFFGLQSLLDDSFDPLVRSVCALVLIFIFLLPASAGLMETPLAILLMLSALIAFKKNNAILTGFFAGLAVGVRLEYAALLILFPLFFWSWKKLKGFIAGASGPILLYLVYTLVFFGTIIPFPAISKNLVYSIDWLDFFAEMPSPASYPEWLRAFWVHEWKAICVSFALVLLGIGLTRIAMRRGVHPWHRLLLALPVVILSVYFVRGVYVFPWYAPLYALPLALFFVSQFSKIDEGRLVLALLLLVALFNPIYIGLRGATSFIFGEDSYYDDYSTGLRVKQYLKIGNELAKDFPDAVLITSEIGALGWAFEGKIIDGGALVSPEVLKYHPMPVPEDRPWNVAGSIPYQAVLEFQPDLIVSMPSFSRSIRREMMTGVLNRYKLYKTFPAIPEEESRRSGIYKVWYNSQIDIFMRAD